MSRFHFTGVLAAMILVSCVGCATTTVTKNPGPKDKGIRFYRPKPYLLVKPLHYDKASGGDVVSITIEYLPDYNEEYSIHARAGLGKNATKVSLEHGWNLTQMDQDLDSQTDENVGAIASLAGAIVPSLTSNRQNGPTKSSPGLALECVARNVPYGLYESVVGRDTNGCKHLYGWRYVGFAPFAGCPMVAEGGGECASCETMDLYGLVTQNGVMAFVSLSQLRDAAIRFPATESPPPAAPANTSANALTKVRIQEVAAPIVNEHFKQSGRLGKITIDDLEVEIEIVATVEAWQAQDIPTIHDRIQTELRRVANDVTLNVTLTHKPGNPEAVAPAGSSMNNTRRHGTVRDQAATAAKLRPMSPHGAPGQVSDRIRR